MPLGTFKANVKVSFLGHNGKSTGSHMKEFEDLSIQSEIELGTYEELVQYAGLVRLEVCLIFDPASELALPTTLSASSQKALHHSLDGPTFVDYKVLPLFSQDPRSSGTPETGICEISPLL